MPERPETWAGVMAWLEQNWQALYAGLLATLIAGLRVMYGGGNLRRVVLEAPLCGLLALTTSHGLVLLGIPASTGPFFGGLIGLLGVEWTRATARKVLNRKAEKL